MADYKATDAVIAAVKKQYIVKDPQPGTEGAEADDGETPDAKKLKLDNSNTNEENNDKQRADRNKRRYPRPAQRFNYAENKPLLYQRLCRKLIDVPEEGPMPVCSLSKCKCLHDVQKFLQVKPPDIADECHIFNLKGHCRHGVACRFSKKHITEDGRNKQDAAKKSQYEDNTPKTLHFYSKELEAELRARTYDFKKSEAILDALPTFKQTGPMSGAAPYQPFRPPSDIDFTEDIDVPTPKVESIPPLVPELEEDKEPPIGPCPDDDLFRQHLSEKKKLDWKNKLYLAPVSLFGNLPFRRICKEYGADVTCSERATASALLQGQGFEWLLTKRHETEDFFGVQLLDNNLYALTRCAQILEEKTQIDFLDLCVATPVEPIYRPRNFHQFRKEKLMETVIRCVSRVTNLPVTVSTRIGDYSEDKIIERFIPNYKKCQVSMVSIRAQRSRNNKQPLDWNYINNTAQLFNPVPVYALTDVFNYHDYLQVKQDNPNVTGFQIGRGALVKPWIFSEIKQERDWDISSNERFDMLKRFVNYGLEHWGSDSKGVEATRRFLLDWLSLLCRYIPVGLLEQPPQKINERPPKYLGRNDLETIMGSQNPSDWIKISEMFLGPVPEIVSFVPKIRGYYWPPDV